MESMNKYAEDVLLLQRALQAMNLSVQTALSIFNRQPELLQNIMEETAKLEHENKENMEEITHLESNVLKLRADLEGTKSSLSITRDELESAKKEAEGKDTLNNEWAKEADEWERKAKDCEVRLANAQAEICELKERLSNSELLMEQMNRANGKIDEYECVVQDLRHEVAEWKNKSTDLENKLADAKIELKKLKKFGTASVHKESRQDEILQKIAELDITYSDLSTRCRNSDCILDGIGMEKTTGDCPHKFCICRNVMPEDWKKVLAPFREGENQ